MDPRARRCGALGRRMACGGALSWSIPRSGALRRFGARPDLAERLNNVPSGTVSSVVLVEPWHDEIARAANNKLNLRLKSTRTVRLFLKQRVGVHAAGTELPAGDCAEYLTREQSAWHNHDTTFN